MNHEELLNVVLKHFIHIAPSILPSCIADVAEQSEMLAVWKEHNTEDGGKPKAIYDEQSKNCYGFLYGREREKGPIGGIRILLNYLPHDSLVQFLRMYFGELTKDLDALVNLGSTWKATWPSLQATQFVRAIANSTSFPKDKARTWVRYFDQVAGLTYEGKPTGMKLVIPYRITEFQEQLTKDCYVPFKESVSLEDMLFRQKWTRAVVDGERVALVASAKKNGLAKGFLSLSALDERDDSCPFAPHQSLRLLLAYLKSSDIVFLTGPSGDIYIMTGKEICWHKHQGRWRVLDYDSLCQIVRPYLNSLECAVDLVRICADLSFERKGALLCVPNSKITAKQAMERLIVDNTSPERSNLPLRRALHGMSVRGWGNRQVIAAAAGTDGATILSADGKVLDVACMIKDPELPRLQASGFNKQASFPGARTRAAWNASMEGLAIKVSEDGPITVYEKGNKRYDSAT